MSQEFTFTIVRESEQGDSCHDFCFKTDQSNQRPMALDVLLQAQATNMPDLAYRYGCRNALCGVCTIDVNGKPKLACRTKLRDGDRLSALSSLPVIRDLVVDRSAVNRQLQNRLPNRSGIISAPDSADLEAYQSLNRCIECYACLSGCPMHERNSPNEPVDEQLENEQHALSCNEYGNPYALLKLQQARLDPRSSESNRKQALDTAVELGLDACLNCKGCRCGVGIDLKKEVIAPLVEAWSHEESK